MAKEKQKGDKKRKGGGGAGVGGAGAGGAGTGGAFWAQLLRETIGNFAGQLIADGTEQMTKGSNAKVSDGAAEEEPEADVAADVLRVLAESGPKSIAELIATTGAGLTPMLRALQTAREFRLVEIVGEDERVQLTPCGSRTAAVLRREQIV